MRDKAQHIAHLAKQYRLLASSSKTQMSCPLVNINELTQVLIDACCAQLSCIN